MDNAPSSVWNDDLRPNAGHQPAVYVDIGGTRNQGSANLFQIGIRVAPIQVVLRGQLQVQTSRDGAGVDDGSRTGGRGIRRQRNQQSSGQVAQGERSRKANSGLRSPRR